MWKKLAVGSGRSAVGANDKNSGVCVQESRPGSRLPPAERPLSTKRVVGLIGGMGSGKSLVAELFRRRGAKVISGDQLGHEALRQPDVLAQVVGRWGRSILEPDGTVSRRRLGAIVFADAQERRALEALVFPSIERRIREEIVAATNCSDFALIVLDAAIMLEAGWQKACDWLVYVHAPRAARLQRLQAQRGWDAKEVRERENAQLPLTEKVSRADYVVDNSGGPERVAQQVDDLLRQWGIAQATAEKGE
jgi:dephospho-CoA kinase